LEVLASRLMRIRRVVTAARMVLKLRMCMAARGTAFRPAAVAMSQESRRCFGQLADSLATALDHVVDRGRIAESRLDTGGQMTGVGVSLTKSRWIQPRLLLPLAAAVLLTAWVQRQSLPAFFSSPDDLVHLQQAAGLRPTLPSPFRFLSQVMYFRMMYALVGLDPAPYHVLSLLVHLVNVGLLFSFLRSCRASILVSWLASSLFGSFPLFFPVLASAVGMNDELALAFTIVSLMLIRLESGWAILAAGAAFLAAILCKESVVSLPLVALAMRLPDHFSAARRLTLIGMGVVFAAALLAVPPQGLSPYAVQLGPNVFHNLMTYAAWSVNLVRPIPDLVSSFDPAAWHVGVWVYGLILASWIALRDRGLIQLGAAWWVVGLLPVLILEFQTYRHYLYPALPGLAVIAATGMSSLAGSLVRLTGSRKNPGNGSNRAPEWGVVAILVACSLAYAARASSLITQRIQARVPGTELALDPIVRRQEVARNALASLAQSLNTRSGARIAVFSPEGTGRVFGARSGRQYAGPAATRGAYSLLEASLDGDGAVRLFFPSIDSIAFIGKWTPRYADYDLFLASQDGRLLHAGPGPEGHVTLGRFLLEQGWYTQTRDYLAVVLERYPEEANIRLLYASAVFKLGDRARAVEELDRIVRTSPDTDAGRAAAIILRAATTDSVGHGPK